MRFAIYKESTGEILRTITCLENLIDMQVSDGEAFTEMQDGDDSTHYVSLGSLVLFPAQPTEAHIFDWGSKIWVDPRTLADLKLARRAVINADRTELINSDFTWDGSVFNSDPVSYMFIVGAVSKALVNPEHTEVWTLADNTYRTLTAAEIIAMATVMGEKISAAMATGRILQDAIEAATTPEEVAAVVWPA